MEVAAAVEEVSPPLEYRGNISRQILTANDIPRWEKNDIVLIAGFLVVCKNETSPLHDRSQHLEVVDLTEISFSSSKGVIAVGNLKFRARNESEWIIHIEQHIAFAKSGRPKEKTIEDYLPLPPSTGELAATDLVDFSTLLGERSHSMPNDLEDAVVAALLQENMEEHSGSLFPPHQITVAVDLGRHGIISLYWENSSYTADKSKKNQSNKITSESYRLLETTGALIVDSAVFDNVRPAQYSKVVEFVARANFGLPAGTFIFDYDAQKVILRTSVQINSTLPFQDQATLVQNIIEVNLKIHRQYIPGLTALLEADLSANRAIATVEGESPSTLEGETMDLTAIIVEVSKILDQHNLSYDIRDQSLVVTTILRNEPMFIVISVQDDVVMVKSHVFSATPRYCRADISELTMMASTACKVGQFNFDYKGGQVLLQTELPIKGILLGDMRVLLEPLILENIATHEKFFPAFEMVVRRGIKASVAFRSVVFDDAPDNPGGHAATTTNGHANNQQRPTAAAAAPPPAPQLLPPQALAPSRPIEGELNCTDISLRSFIGQGGMGVVYCANCADQTVAIKEILRDANSTLEEISVHTKLSHPNLVQVKGFVRGRLDLGLNKIVSDPNKILMVMEYCEGGNLRQWLSQPLTVRPEVRDLQALKLMLNAAKGIAALHGRSPVIIHRDVKPENIFLTAGQEEAKIGDFGLARELTRCVPNASRGSEYTYGRDVGTLFYIAPEIFGQQQYTVGCDAYAFGVILYEIFILRGDGRVYSEEDTLDEERFRQRIADGALAISISDAAASTMATAFRSAMIKLIRSCVHRQSYIRPRFPLIVQKLEDMISALQNAIAPSTAAASAAVPVQGPALQPVVAGPAATPRETSVSNFTPRNACVLPLLEFPTYVDRIGNGSYGEAFRCEFVGTAVVIKQVLEVDDVDAFINEISVQAQLAHSNVVPVLGVLRARVVTERLNATTDEVRYKLEAHSESILMVTEYCAEGDLSQWLKKIKCGEIDFNERVTLAIMLDVARGMAFNDVRHILHRDLKPANIFLEANSRRAKVGDFGLAKIVERIATNPQQLNQSRTYYDVDRKGSMVFMAPEVLQHGRCDRAADVYSFGILLHNVFVSFNEEESFDIERVRAYAAEYQLRFVAAFVSMLLFVPDFRPRFPPQEATRMSSVVYKGISSLAEQCWQRDPSLRPSFKDICSVLSQLIQHVANQPSTSNGQGQTTAPSLPAVANPGSLPSSPTAVFGAPAKRTPSTDPVSPSPSPPTGAATRQHSAPAPAWIVLGPSLAATSPSPLDLTAALVSSSSLIRGNGDEHPFASPMTNTSMTSPNGMNRFDLIATLHSMREDLHIPDDVDIPTAVAIIAENLDMVEQIKDMKPRKRQVQCLWRQFVDSEDEAARMWPYAPQFSLMEVVRRMQTEMKLSMELTVTQIVRDAAAILLIDDECSRWSTVKLKAKRVAIELGYLPEELLPLLEAELSTQVM